MVNAHTIAARSDSFAVIGRPMPRRVSRSSASVGRVTVVATIPRPVSFAIIASPSVVGVVRTLDGVRPIKLCTATVLRIPGWRWGCVLG